MPEWPRTECGGRGARQERLVKSSATAKELRRPDCFLDSQAEASLDITRFRSSHLASVKRQASASEHLSINRRLIPATAAATRPYP